MKANATGFILLSFLNAVHCFDKGYLGKHPVAWKEYCVVYWLKELQGNSDRCTGFHVITKILLQTALTLFQTSQGFYMSAVQGF